jgi:type IV secretion system protein VirD4
MTGKTAGSTERERLLLLLFLAGVGALEGLSLLAWLSGQTAGLLWYRRWPHSSFVADGTGVLWSITQDPSHPGRGWPAAARSDIPPATVYYAAVLVVTSVLVALVLIGVALVRQRWPAFFSGRWAHTNPGFKGYAGPAVLRSGRSLGPTVHSWSLGYDAWLGFISTGLGWRRPLRGSGDRQTAGVIGIPGTGKTRGLIVPGLMLWSGSAVVTSTKTDVLRLAGRRREQLAASRGGQVLLLDWAELVGSELGMPSVRWDPLDGCKDTRVVSNRVAAMLGAVEGPHHATGGEDQFWKAGAGNLLRPYLHAAALADKGISQVLQWLDQQEFAEPAQIIEEMNPPAVSWGQRLQGLAGSPSQITIGGYTETAKACFAALQEPTVLRNCSSSTIDVEQFLATASTLFVVDPAGEARLSPSAPLTAALLDWLADRAYQRGRRQPDQVCEPRLGFYLDELPNVAPWNSLPKHIAQGSSQGVNVMLWSSQNFGQLVARYGREEAANIWSLTRYAMVFGGGKEVDWMEGLSKLLGEYEERESSRTEGRGETSVSVHPVRRPILPIEVLAQLPAGEAVLLTGGRVLKVYAPPVQNGRQFGGYPLEPPQGVRPLPGLQVQESARRSVLRWWTGT